MATQKRTASITTLKRLRKCVDMCRPGANIEFPTQRSLMKLKTADISYTRHPKQSYLNRFEVSKCHLRIVQRLALQIALHKLRHPYGYILPVACKTYSPDDYPSSRLVSRFVDMSF
jgi:hypothetical protein